MITTSAEEMRRRAAEARAAGYSCVVALGGDGTIHEVINGAVEGAGAEEVIPVAVLPGGGGNDLARALGMPLDPVAAAHGLLHSRLRSIDLLQMASPGGRSRVFAGAGGVGLDAEAALLANTRFRNWPGMSRYIAAAVAAFCEASPLRIRIEADGKAHDFQAQLVAVANTPSYGGGVQICPAALIDDGWMDVAVVAPLSWTRVLEGLLLALRDGDIRWPEMRRMRARRLRIETNRPMSFHGDGEILGETPVEIELLPGRLDVLGPAQK